VNKGEIDFIDGFFDSEKRYLHFVFSEESKMYKFVTRDYSEVPEKYQIFTEKSDMVIETGFHLAIESEVLAALEGNYLVTRDKVATQTYFCGGFRKRGIMTTNYDFLSSPFKIIKNGFNPSRNFLA
jgi:hypothetical protein